MNLRMIALAAVVSTSLLSGCGGGGGDSGVFVDDDGAGGAGNVPAISAAYIVVAWNDLGMHCLNPSYDTAVILPPYNTVWAQVLKRGNPPQVVTSGVTVSYRVINNTNSQKGAFAQFWTYANTLFQGLFPAMANPLPANIGITGNGLLGNMTSVGNHFEVTGIPVVPVEDNGVKNPYQVAEITVKDASGAIIAQTRATVPTSDEINCGKCHAVGGTLTDVFNDVLAKHDADSTIVPRTNLSSPASKPVLCASCHGSPALGTTGPGSSGKYLSQAIHGFHATLPTAQQPSCYDCHPGASTQCNRSTKHTNNNAADGNCVACHGDLAKVASSILPPPTGNSRVPWVTEPKCAATNCHSGTIPQVDTGTTLYRNAVGHGGVYCAGCHGSPHAMVPSNVAKDNYQALQYQGKAYVLGDCRVCHSSSRGGGSNFLGEHRTKTSACNICHTGFSPTASAADFPHSFQWKTRLR